MIGESSWMAALNSDLLISRKSSGGITGIGKLLADETLRRVLKTCLSTLATRIEPTDSMYRMHQTAFGYEE